MSTKSVKLTFDQDGMAPSYAPEDQSDGKLSKQEVDSKLGLDVPRFIEIGPVAIFKEGTWNGNTYNRDDVIEMSLNFHRMIKTWRPTLKISHEQGWHLADNEHTEEACGRLTDMWEERGTVFANLAFSIPFYIDKIAGKKLNHKSVEIWPSMEYNEVVFNNVISNVALLGISMPGCGDLGEIEDENTRYRFFSKDITSSVKPLIYVVNEEGNGVMPDETNVDIDATEDNQTPVVPDVDNSEEASENTEAPESFENSEAPEGAEAAELDNQEESEEEANEDVPAQAPDSEEAPVDVPEPAESPEANESAEAPVEMSAKPDELLKASFEAQLKSIEAKFAAQFDAQNAIIEEFKKERVETKITHDLEDLIKGGHVAPANRELLKSLFMAMDSAQKVNFSIGEKVVEDASTLLKHLLKSYSVWQSDASTTSADIDTEMADALPETDEEVTVKYRGVELPLDNAKENDMAKDLQKKYALAGKTVKFWDCYLEVIKNRK